MAEKITVGGITLEIDENDELWKQLVEKYSEGKKTGWEIPNKGAKAYTLYGGSPQGDYCIGVYNPLANHNVVSHAAIFADYKFARMQARAEEIRRKLLKFAAENEGTHERDEAGYVIVWEDGAFRCLCWKYEDLMFAPTFTTKQCAEMALEKYRDDLFWLATEYKQRLDQEV